MVHAGEPFLQLPFSLHSPDGKDIVVPGHEGHGGVVAVYKAPGQALHGDKAHVLFPAEPDQVIFLLSCQVGEGELQGLVQTGLCDLEGHADLMGRAAYMADLSLRLCLEHALVHAGPVAFFPALSHLVELVDVDIVGAQVSEGCIQILPESLRRFCSGLGGDKDPVPGNFLQGFAQLFFAVGIGSCGIKVADAALKGSAQELYGFLF